MVVISNRRLGAAAELLVSSDVASAMLTETAAAARPLAQGRWEHELVQWLDDRARTISARDTSDLDVTDIAWSPENFERQQRFVIDAIERAALLSLHARALQRWSTQIAQHPREHVLVGRRWAWAQSSSPA
ncbi:MAG TPA: hypothetical protein VGM90_38275 [Kofleriaceae bacterium]|jgi:hypothetical protein